MNQTVAGAPAGYASSVIALRKAWRILQGEILCPLNRHCGTAFELTPEEEGERLESIAVIERGGLVCGKQFLE